MRAAVLIAIALMATGCSGDGGADGDRAPTAPVPSSPPPAAPLPATTDVAPPDAIARLAASFHDDLFARQRHRAGLGPMACRDLAGSAACIQLLRGGGACSGRFRAGGRSDVPDVYRATCIEAGNAWRCDLEVQYFAVGDRAGEAAFRDECPPPDATSAEQLAAILAVATSWEMPVEAATPPTSTAS